MPAPSAGVLGEIIAKDGETVAVGALLGGQIPAVIREVVERSKLDAIRLSDGGSLVITEEALLAAAESMSYHWGLLGKDEDKRSSADKLMDALGVAMRERLGDEGLAEAVEHATHFARQSRDYAQLGARHAGAVKETLGEAADIAKETHEMIEEIGEDVSFVKEKIKSRF